MDIYYRQDTGIITPQNEKLDYFRFKRIGKDLDDNYAYAIVYFFRTLENAQAKVPPRAERELHFPIIENEDVSSGVLALLQLEDFVTTAQDTVSFSGAVKQ